MADKVSPIPEGFHSLTPALTCKGAAKAIDFYKRAFGAKEISRMEMDGMIGHSELQIGDSKIFVSDEFPGMSCRARRQLQGAIKLSPHLFGQRKRAL